MSRLLVSYDLRQPRRDYGPLHDHLREFDHCRPLESVWLVAADLSPKQLRDELRPLLDADDGLLVVDFTGKASAWQELDGDSAGWIKAH